MGRDRIGLPSPLQHEKLGKDSDGLQPYREGPQYLHIFDLAIAPGRLMSLTSDSW